MNVILSNHLKMHGWAQGGIPQVQRHHWVSRTAPTYRPAPLDGPGHWGVFRCKTEVECHLLGTCRALLATRRNKAKEKPTETGYVYAGTWHFAETRSQQTGREQPTARLVHLVTWHVAAKWSMKVATGSCQQSSCSGELWRRIPVHLG